MVALTLLRLLVGNWESFGPVQICADWVSQQLEREQDKGANGFTVYSLARGLLSRTHSRKSGCFTDKADTLALCLPYFTG